MEQQFHAPGKLLLTGEYLVLRGAEALAVPTAIGQSMKVEDAGKDLDWQSLDHQGNSWFSARFDARLQILESSDPGKAQFLQALLQTAFALSGKKWQPAEVITHLEFPNNWGLGSSSTLTYLISQWLKVDPFQLFFKTQNGSGYDIACALENQPLMYHLKDKKPGWKTVRLPEAFPESFLVHLGHKQHSREEVERFKKSQVAPKEIQTITALSRDVLKISSKEELIEKMKEHEEILGSILKTTPVQQRLFQDFEGGIKSLGAWGGDFVWAAGENAEEYFNTQGYSTVLKFDKLVAGSPKVNLD